MSQQTQERAALVALVAKWREDALGVDAMGYSQQADRIRDCANELEAALAQPPAGAWCPTHGDPLVCIACEQEEDARPEWKVNP